MTTNHRQMSYVDEFGHYVVSDGNTAGELPGRRRRPSPETGATSPQSPPSGAPGESPGQEPSSRIGDL